MTYTYSREVKILQEQLLRFKEHHSRMMSNLHGEIREKDVEIENLKRDLAKATETRGGMLRVEAIEKVVADHARQLRYLETSIIMLRARQPGAA